MSADSYDRTIADIGNVVSLEHVNLFVPDLNLATLFYTNTLGLTRDPYIDLGPALLWFNCGRQQFHIPLGDPQALRGVIELIIPDLQALTSRLGSMAEHLSSTEFEYEVGSCSIDIRCPWGNQIRCLGPSADKQTMLGLAAIEFPVKQETAEGIGRFYHQVLGAPATTVDGVCTVVVGPGQELRFCETEEPIRDYDGHHIAVYVAGFSKPHKWLNDRELIVEESNEHQYRFNWIVDPSTGEQLFELEHEVRSLYNPLHNRPLVNRNPDQNLQQYVPGADQFYP